MSDFISMIIGYVAVLCCGIFMGMSLSKSSDKK